MGLFGVSSITPRCKKLHAKQDQIIRSAACKGGRVGGGGGGAAKVGCRTSI